MIRLPSGRKRGGALGRMSGSIAVHTKGIDGRARRRNDDLADLPARLEPDYFMGCLQMTDARLRPVAIIDDDRAVLDSMTFLLGMTGYASRAYDSPESFLLDHECQPACLIVDQHMPKMTGLELIRRLRATAPDFPILLVTAAPSDALRRAAANLGVKLLDKPPSDDALFSFVLESLQRCSSTEQAATRTPM